jgi:hypothetical protein
MSTMRMFYGTKASAAESSVKPSVTQGQLDYLNEMIKRRRAFNPREQTEESFESSQYYSFKEAAKAGCELSALRDAVGNRNNITETLFARLFEDQHMTDYDAVKNLKALIAHEQDILKQQACVDIFRAHAFSIAKISRLSMVFNYLPGEVNALLTELIDCGKLVAPVESQQIQAVRKKQEDELCDTMMAFYAANGKSEDPRLHELIPMGTFFKLQKMIAERNAAAEKANAPVPAAVVAPDLLDFNRLTF